MTTLAAPGPELGRANRRIIAERLRWPADAVWVCEEIEATHPGWSVNWLRENTNTSFEHPAGYWARRASGYRAEVVEVFAPDVDELLVRINLAAPPRYGDHA